MKSPNHRQARSQNKGLSRASWLWTQPIPCRRQAGEGSQSRKGAIVAPGRHPTPNCKQPSLITKTSWDSGRSTSTGRVAARDQLPRRDTRHTWEGAPVVHPENQVAGTGERISRNLQLRATTRIKDLATWVARTWDGRKMQAQQSLHLCGVPKNMNLSGLDVGSACKPGPTSDSSQQSNMESEQCRLGKHTRCEQGQTHCGWITVNTRQWYLFAVFLPPQSTTEQMSLKKSDHHLAPCVRAEIRHWRDQQTEEAKINRGNRFGSGAID